MAIIDYICAMHYYYTWQKITSKIGKLECTEADKKIMLIFSSTFMINLDSYVNRLTVYTLVDMVVDITFHSFNFAVIVYAIRSLYFTPGIHLTYLSTAFLLAYVLEWFTLYGSAILSPYYKLPGNIKNKMDTSTYNV